MGRGKTGVPGANPLGAENQQTQPAYGAGSQNPTHQTRATLAEGEHSHESQLCHPCSPKCYEQNYQ